MNLGRPKQAYKVSLGYWVPSLRCVVVFNQLVSIVLSQRLEAHHIQRLKRVGSVRREDEQQNLVLIIVIDKGLRYVATVLVNDE